MMSLILLLSFVSATIAADWNYDRCDSKYGPASWSGICKTGKEQTPINLCGAIAFPSSVPSVAVSGYSTARSVSGYNPGYTVQINIDGTSPPTLTTTLASVIGRSLCTGECSETWKLAQMHVHVGRSGLTTEGSEHYLQGQAYPLEAHFVHYNSKYTSASAAINSGATDALLVVGVFFQLGDSDTATMKVVGDAVSGMTKTAKTLSTQVTLSDIYDGSGSFYSYKGGLTVPTCNEFVTWMVMSSPKTITTTTLNKFKAATTNPTSAQKFAVQASTEVQGKFGTFRPLQAISGRSIWFSGETFTACSTVNEPTFTCTTATSGGNFFRPSAVLPLMMLAMWLSCAHH